VIPAARTGRESKRRKAVTKIDHANKDNLLHLVEVRVEMVTMKFIAPKIELIPATCRENIAKSTPPPL
jgi:hypothetical protein